MRRALAPYAIGAVLVVAGSIAALAAALAAGGLLEERGMPGESAAPAAARAPAELSRAGRIAYWRTDPNGEVQLWVANLDGSGRRVVATSEGLSRVGETRWAPDGNAVAYVDRGQRVVVQRLDGPARYELGLPQSILAANARIIEFAWSTDGARLAATVRGASAGTPNGETDVYVVSATTGEWRSVTGLRDAFLSQWISPTELLVHTQRGLIAVARADGTAIVPLTGLVATSPFVGDDGRVYFLAGQVAPTIRDATVPVVNAGQARVWSTTVDGGVPQQETAQAYDDVRLAGRWPTGRFIVHQGASTSLAFLALGTPPLDPTLGVVQRVAFSPDRRTAIGLSDTRIYRYDVGHPESPVVLLSDVAQPDAWYPGTITVVRGSGGAATGGPRARYAFALAGSLWATDAAGVPHLVRRLDTEESGLRRLSGVALPQWSPRGDRILYFDVRGNSFAGGAFVTEPSGAVIPLSGPEASGPFPAWTPDGNVAVARFIGARDSAEFSVPAEVRIVDPRGTSVLATYPGREIAFGGGRTFLIDNGRPNAALQTRTDHAIVEVTPSGTRAITDAAFLNARLPFDGGQNETATALQLSMLGASADGAYLSVRISPASASGGPFTFAILRSTDGTATNVLPGQGVADVRWSPTGHLVGMTVGESIPQIRDAETNAVVTAVRGGRFAGWSPDGTWFYVARDTGLFAMPLAGGAELRVSAVGVPVSATAP